MGEAITKLMPQASAAAEAGLSAGSTAGSSVPRGCGAATGALAGVAAGAAGPAVLQPASAKKIPNKHPGINLTLGMIMPRDYAGLVRSSSSYVREPGDRWSPLRRSGVF